MASIAHLCQRVRMNRSLKTQGAALCCSLTLLSMASAQDLYLLGGGLQSNSPIASTYAWSVTYTEQLSPHVAASFSWLNEGHVPSHHRDGHVTQLWWYPDPGRRLNVAVGAGFYRYFDTVAAGTVDHYVNGHGSALLASATAIFQGKDPWLYQLRAQRVWASQSINTWSLLLGVGYRLRQDTAQDVRETDRDYHAELTLLGGATIVNSFSSERAVASSLELRRRFGNVVRVSAALLNEGDARLIRRNGTLLEAWLEPSFFRGRLTLGAGGGGYVAIDRYHPNVNGRKASGIVSLTTSYHLAPRWLARLSWHRVVSDYDKDADILLLGAGYNL
jgi:hypothetical protein